jgi:hypothetical protein
MTGAHLQFRTGLHNLEGNARAIGPTLRREHRTKTARSDEPVDFESRYGWRGDRRRPRFFGASE